MVHGVLSHAQIDLHIINVAPSMLQCMVIINHEFGSGGYLFHNPGQIIHVVPSRELFSDLFSCFDSSWLGEGRCLGVESLQTRQLPYR